MSRLTVADKALMAGLVANKMKAKYGTEVAITLAMPLSHAMQALEDAGLLMSITADTEKEAALEQLASEMEASGAINPEWAKRLRAIIGEGVKQ